MRTKLEEPMRLSEVMAEYLNELEATCAAYQEENNPGRSPILIRNHATGSNQW